MVNEVQRFDISGSPGSGRFILSFRDVPTEQIPYHPAAGDVERALEALSTIGPGNVVVSKDGNWGYVCGFQNELADQDLPLLVADDSAMGGGGTVTVSPVTEGGSTTPDPGPEGPAHLAMPCTALDLFNFADGLRARAPGSYHRVTVTSDATGITVS
jgi:hypothetical protein